MGWKQEVWNTFFGAALLCLLLLVLGCLATINEWPQGRFFTTGLGIGLFVLVSWLVGRGAECVGHQD